MLLKNASRLLILKTEECWQRIGATGVEVSRQPGTVAGCTAADEEEIKVSIWKVPWKINRTIEERGNFFN